MTRNMTANGNGTASYVFAHEAPPAWLVASVPEATEAKAAWEAENDKGRELARALSAAQKAAPATKWHGDPGKAVAGPARGVTQAAWEAGRAAVEEAEDAVRA